ncbi:MAG: division/cell wall cluster transcriptional repressor MraZ [Saprospiraceae bacterium]|nr:division/cell wall cluster transcriptional repressor MraZ [Saprospiraceae bacterium]
MISLSGEYECKIDDRGRIKLPQKLISALGDKRTLEFIINRGFDNNLIMYPKEVWEQKTKEINQLNIYDKRHRDVIRYFYRGATEVTNDSADRILLPAPLRTYAGIDKEVILFAFNNMIELWSKEGYQQMINEEPEDFSSLVQEVFATNNTKDNQNV